MPQGLLNPYKSYPVIGGGATSPEVLEVDGINTPAQLIGSYTNLNDDSDGTIVSTVSNNQATQYTIEASGTTGDDVVSKIEVLCRLADELGTTDSWDVSVYAGGILKGTVNAAMTTGTFQDFVLNTATWDAITQAQLASLEVRLTSVEVDGDSNTYKCSKLQVRVTFAPASGFDMSGNVGWWDLGDVNENHTGVLNLTNNNTVTFSSGHIGTAADMEDSGGEEQYLSHADTAVLDITGALSMGCWYKPESNITGTEALMGKYTNNSPNRSYCILLPGSTGSAQAARALIGDVSSAFSSGDSTTTFTFGTWYFIVMTYEPSVALRIWINGVNEASNTTSVPSSTKSGNSIFGIGKGSTSHGSVDGMIESAFLWGRLLSPAEIATLYNGGVGMKYIDL